MIHNELVLQRLSSLEYVLQKSLQKLFDDPLLHTMAHNQLSASHVASYIVEAIEKVLAAHQQQIIVQLSQRVIEGQQLHQQMVQLLSQSDQKIRVCQQQLFEWKQKNNSLEEQKSRLQNQILGTEDRLKKQFREIQKEAANQNIKGKLFEELQSTHKKMVQRQKLLEEKQMSLSNNLQISQERVSALEKLNEKDRQAILIKNKRIQQLEQAQQLAKRDHSQRCKQLQNLKMQQVQVQHELSRCKRKNEQLLRNLQAESQQSKNEKSLLKQQIQSLQIKIEELQDLKKKFQKEKRSLLSRQSLQEKSQDQRTQRRLAAQQAELLQLQKDKESLERSNKLLQDKVSLMEHQVEGPKREQRRESKHENRFGMERQLLAQRQDNIGMQQSMIKIQAEKLSLQKSIDRLQKQLQVTKAQVNCSSTNNQNLSKVCQEIRQLSADIAKVNQDNTQLNKRNQSQRIEINKLMSDVQTANKNVFYKEQIISKLQGHLNFIQQENMLVKSRSEQLQQEYNQLRQQMVQEQRRLTGQDDQKKISMLQLNTQYERMISQYKLLYKQFHQLKQKNRILEEGLKDKTKQVDDLNNALKDFEIQAKQKYAALSLKHSVLQKKIRSRIFVLQRQCREAKRFLLDFNSAVAQSKMQLSRTANFLGERASQKLQSHEQRLQTKVHQQLIHRQKQVLQELQSQILQRQNFFTAKLNQVCGEYEKGISYLNLELQKQIEQTELFKDKLRVMRVRQQDLIDCAEDENRQKNILRRQVQRSAKEEPKRQREVQLMCSQMDDLTNSLECMLRRRRH